jgi:DNA-binding CsgD family transcriptional regulator
MLSAVESALRGAWLDATGAILVKGEPGLGKTAFVHAVCHRAAALGLQVARAQCADDDPAGRLQVVRDLLGQLPGCADLGPAGDDPTADPAQLAAEVERRIAGAASAPMLIAVDDAHLADPESASFLRHLSRRTRVNGVRMVLAVEHRRRTASLTPLDRLYLEHDTWMLRLHPLSESATWALLEHRFGDALPPGVVTDLHARTAGVPLLIVAAIAIAGERTDAEDGPFFPPGPNPPVVRWVLRRLAAAPPDAYRLLEAIAVLHPDVDLSLAAAAAGVNASEAGRLADVLVDQAILGAGRPLAVRQELVRTSILENVPAARRSEMREFAAQLQASRGRNEAGAELLLQTEPAGRAWAASVLTDAARRAFDREDTASARRYAERAFAETLSTADQPDLLLMLSQLAANEGDPVAVEHLLHAREEHADPVAVVATGLQLADQLWEGSMRPTLLDILVPVGRELASLDPDLALQLEIMCAITDESAGQPAASSELACIRDSMPGADPDLTRLARAVHAVAAATDPSAVSASEVFGTLRDSLSADLVTRTRSRWATAAVLRGLAAMVRMGVTVEVDPLLRVVQVEAEQDGHRRDSTAAAILLAESLRVQGRLEQADDELVAAVQSSQEDHVWVRYSTVQRAVVMALRGGLECSLELLPVGGVVDWRTLGPLFDSHAAESCGRLRLLAGQWQAAIEHFSEAEALAQAHGITNPALVSWREGRVRALLGIGERDGARALAQQNLELAESFGAPVPLSRALRSLAAASPESDGLPLLERALALLDGTRNEVDRCCTRIDVGCALLALGDVGKARQELRDAGDLAARMGATALMTSASDALRAAGARPRRLHLRGSDALTPSERRVAELAAEGHTNGSIASSLFINMKTVESHLARAYRKLGVKSRVELQALLGNGRRPEEAGG